MRIRPALLILSIVLSPAFLFAKTPDKHNLSKEIPADYFIEAALDTSAKTLSGTQRIRFINPTDREISLLVLHLYPNAFKDSLTTMARAGAKIKTLIMENPSSITCDSILVNGSRPDSVYIEETLLFIRLGDVLKPNDKLNLSLSFKLMIPRSSIRMGYDINGNYLLAHWHPILAGYQKNEPVLFQYSYNGEFFSNFANYEVKLKIPKGFKLLSTSNISRPDSTVNGMACYSLAAKRVIDFAFACGPAWQSESYYYSNIEINILSLAKNRDKLPNMKEYINGSLAFFGEYLYPYPYQNLNYVDFDPGAVGMELPAMAVMSFEGGTFRKNDIANTVIHETAHQWFYATIATNEYDEPWLDEGISTYLTERALAEILGETFIYDFYGLKISFLDFAGISTRLAGTLDPLATSSDDFYTDHYFFNVYGRAAAVLKTLEGVIGTPSFDKALKDFALSYKFFHPDATDFENTVEQSSGQDLDWFFDRYVFGTSRVDYEISSLTGDGAGGSYKTRVEARRNYDGILPQQVVVKFADGSIQGRSWDGREKYKSFVFDYPEPASWAAIDTAYYYLIDENYANNSLKSQPENGSSVALISLSFAMVQAIMVLTGLL